MSFPAAAREALGDAQLRRNMGKATTAFRAKHAAAVAELDDWEALRDAGAAIKERAMATLPEQLVRLEESVTRAGGTVHWARDAAEANAIIAGIVRDHGAREVIKVKSLASDEIGLNEALEQRGIAAIETDLAELIVQLDGDRPSHILVPAIHRNRAEIAALFERTIAQGQQLGLEPRAIAEAARRHLREKFLSVPVAFSGANFGVAETGSIVLDGAVESGRRALTLVPDLHICVVDAARIHASVPRRDRGARSRRRRRSPAHARLRAERDVRHRARARRGRPRPARARDPRRRLKRHVRIRASGTCTRCCRSRAPHCEPGTAESRRPIGSCINATRK